MTPHLNRLFIVLFTIVLYGTIVFAVDYPIVDTGQESCFNNFNEIFDPNVNEPFYGQDAQYDGNQPSYIDNGDSTVTDLVTGLMWVKTSGEKVTYAEAVDGAAICDVGGYDDWRLPSIKELYSLIVFSGIDPSGWSGNPDDLIPFIDTDYFDFEYGDENNGERIIDAQYWSSTEYVSTTMGGDSTVFGVNFADGRIKGYPRDYGPFGQPMVEFVRYVRGNINYVINDFIDNGDGTITDYATNLMWIKADSDSSMNWEEALNFAENLEYAEYNDWRLPNVKELQSIIDYTRSPATTNSPAIDSIFSCTPIIDEGGEINYACYWTGTTHVNWAQNPGTFAAYVAFGEALGFMEFPPGSGNYQLLDVHGAGAQRSDPKSGDPDDWPHGNGPQGDVVRIYNMVRCVRDAGLTGINDNRGGVKLPSKVELLQNYPNPFNAKTAIKYELPQQSHVTIEIYDILGHKVTSLIDEYQPAGYYQVTWSADDFSSGMYFYKLHAGDYTDSKKMLLIK